jgi:putative DNA primase/helicase
MPIAADRHITPLNVPLHYAKLYFAAGYCPIPVKPKSKEPVDNGWQNLRLSEEQLPNCFTPLNNVGISFGEPSSGLVDIDLDNANALQLASYFLPETDFVFGRASKPASHRVYRVPAPGRVRQLKAGGMIVEVRGTGGQTVCPGSVHQDTGERIEFTCPIEDGLPIPAETTREVLDTAATKIAIGSVLLDHWTKGLRHELALAMAGVLAKRGWTDDEAHRLVEAVAKIANDEDLADRVKAVQTTFENHRNGQPIKGWTALVDAIGANAAGHIDKFLGGNSYRDHRAANSNCQWAKANFASDHDAAMTFAAQCEGNLRFSTSSDQWYHRKVQVFEPIADAIAQGVVGDFAAQAQAQVGKDAGGIKSRAKINAIMELARAPLAIAEELIDKDRNHVGLADGRILDLTTGELVTADKEVFVTKKLGTIYDTTAGCARWLEFLNTIFDGNQDKIDFVQRAIGYSLSGDVSEQCFFIMIGTGANGKSTFINALGNMFGDYSGTSPMQTLTVMPFSNGLGNDLADMQGKRFISASDGESGQRLAEAKIKNMTGGDKIKCRSLYQNYRVYDPQFKLWVATNDLPNVTGSDDAIWRRIRVIDFPVTIPESQRDPNLSADLAAEASGILNWALRGYRAWKVGGLKTPAEVTEATGSYRHDNDLVGQFIEARCVEAPSAKCTSKAIHESYTRWCDDNGHTAMPVNTFAKKLKKKGFASRRGQQGNGWTGIDVKPVHQTGDENNLLRMGIPDEESRKRLAEFKHAHG